MKLICTGSLEVDLGWRK